MHDSILLGLGNGTILKFKKKKLELQEVYTDIHQNQVCGILVDQAHQMMVSVSIDKTISINKMEREKAVKEEVLSI